MTSTRALADGRSSGKYAVRRLKARLDHLYKWIAADCHYDHIWDLCCDHGRLGLHVHQNLVSSQQTVHLIDRVPGIIDALIVRYRRLLCDNLEARCEDASSLKLDHLLQPKQSHLFIIAGVGGETIIKILTGLCAHNTAQLQKMACSLDIMLSPNSHTFELRHFLRANAIGLIDEAFVSENGKFHEHLFLRFLGDQHDTTDLHAIGEALWKPWTKDKLHYALRLFRHHQRCAKLKDDANDTIAANAYRELLVANGFLVSDLDETD